MSHRSEIFVTPHDKAIRHRVQWTVVVTSIVLLAGCGGGGGASMRAFGSGPSIMIVNEVDSCGRGGAKREPRQNVLVMSE